MGLYKNNNGVLSPIAGRGKAEYGASTVRTGTITLSSGVAVGSYTTIDVTFSEPMPDADYEVVLAIPVNGSGHGEHTNAGAYHAWGKTATGFRFTVAAPTAAISAGYAINYTAFKLYTDKEYNDILAAMPSNASASNKLVTESSALKVKVKEESIIANPSGYLFLPKGTFAASVGYNSCLLLAWGDNVISKAYVNQAMGTPAIGTFVANTAYTVKYHYIE